jgi:pimeloyl-ACP methyl ester carboxylesterase
LRTITHTQGEHGIEVVRASRVALSLTLLLGCNAVEWQAQRLAKRYERSGLSVATRTLAGGDEVRVWTGGSGPPLVFLHGFGAHADWQWTAQAEAFAPDHQLVIPDLLHFGGSRCVHGEYSLAHQAETVKALLGELGIARADVVGISFGGFVAYTLTVGPKSPVRRLVLVASPGPVYTSEDHAALLQRFNVTSAHEIFVPRDEDDIQRLLEIAYTHPPRLTRGLKRQTLEVLYSDHTEEHMAVLAALSTSHQRTGPRPPVPAGSLLIWGADDPVFPVAIARRIAADEDVELVVLPETRHAPNLERPRAFNDALRRYLAAPAGGS